MMKPETIWKWAARLVAAGVAVALAYRLNGAPLSAETLSWLGAGLVVLIGYLYFAGQRRDTGEDRRLAEFRRGLNCLLAALAWALLPAPWIRLWLATDPYVGAVITFVPVIPLVTLGTFYIVRALTAGRPSVHG